MLTRRLSLVLLLIPFCAAQAARAELGHLDQPVANHVMLGTYERLDDLGASACSGITFGKLRRIHGDATTEPTEFRVPEGYEFVVTQLDYVLDQGPASAGGRALLGLRIVDPDVPRSVTVVEEALAIPPSASSQRLSWNPALTTGGTLEAGTLPCPTFNVSPSGLHPSVFRFYVRGYLIEADGSGGDADGDGVPDETDLCPDTKPDAEVDADGCSHKQFCHAVDPYASSGYACWQADWKGDEPSKPYPYDCRLSGGKCVPY